MSSRRREATKRSSRGAGGERRSGAIAQPHGRSGSDPGATRERSGSDPLVRAVRAGGSARRTMRCFWVETAIVGK